MNVLQKATNWLADLQIAELVLLREMGKVRAEKEKALQFIDMYRRFEAPEEPRPVDAPDVQTGREAPTAVVTPAVVESVAAEEVGQHASSAPIPLGDEASRADEPSGGVEPEGGVLAGGAPGQDDPARIAPAQSTAAPIPPETADTPERLVFAPADPPESEDAEGNEASLAAPGKIPVADQILELQAEHPEWTARQFAEAIGVTQEHVNAAAHKRGIVIARSKVRGPAQSNPSGLSLRQRVENVLAEHPDWTARQIGDHLGVHQKHIASIARNNNLPVRKLSPEEVLEARRRGGAMGGALGKQRREAGEPVEAREPPPAPTPPPEPERPPAPPVLAASPSPGGVVTKPMARAPRGTQFRLRTGRGEGKYLHQSGVGLVPGRTYAWMGSESQLLAVRQKFPEARDMYEEVVEKEAARV